MLRFFIVLIFPLFLYHYTFLFKYILYLHNFEEKNAGFFSSYLYTYDI